MHGGGESVGGSARGRRKRRRNHTNEEVALQITSMADIFTILLVFLLKSYAVSATDVSVSKDVHLPTARGGQDRVEAMKVEITETGIQIEGQPVMTLTNYTANASDISREGILPVLVKALEKEREKQKALAAAQGAENEKKPFDPKLLVIADKMVPYKMLKLILASATMTDYTDFKLVVVTGD